MRSGCAPARRKEHPGRGDLIGSLFGGDGAFVAVTEGIGREACRWSRGGRNLWVSHPQPSTAMEATPSEQIPAALRRALPGRPGWFPEASGSDPPRCTGALAKQKMNEFDAALPRCQRSREKRQLSAPRSMAMRQALAGRRRFHDAVLADHPPFRDQGLRCDHAVADVVIGRGTAWPRKSAMPIWNRRRGP